jgi:hypothetical protein
MDSWIQKYVRCHLSYADYVSLGLIFRDQSSNLKFRLAPVFLSKKIKFDLKQELNIPAMVMVNVGHMLIVLPRQEKFEESGKEFSYFWMCWID